ncbi:PfkB family carbohydrate kinase [Mycoplasma crocodyli]|uniref:Carbohydrate kinase PfkB domain-containing protein n=1 Tax=Mycoplasma crocodyli (strain ATCC 51981 / MP145) TaxID=512564 RepID=D5E5I2_MYCCM|nr:PfkB family carbohydrate kinase [Mycoplasma crocodyli]ADE19351.1 hypothetical protein MCRO_0393 [Mycoplasma crocodyli MP145]
MIKRVLTIGETLIRFNIDNYENILKNNSNYFIGGDALNVASMLGINNNDVEYLTSLNSQSIFNKKIKLHINSNNVKTTFSEDSLDRIGLYYYTPKLENINATVEYDRANSGFSKMIIDNKTQQKIIESNFDLVHSSGITLAVNKNFSISLLNIYDSVIKNDKVTSFDLNFRKKLWKSYSEFKKAVSPILHRTSIVFGWLNETDSYNKIENLSLIDFENLTNYTRNNFKNIKIIVSPFKFNKDNKTYVKGFGFNEGKFFETKAIQYNDKFPVGSGDAFCGMFLNSFLNNLTFEESLIYATSAYAEKNKYQTDSAPILIKDLNIANKTNEIER